MKEKREREERGYLWGRRIMGNGKPGKTVVLGHVAHHGDKKKFTPDKATLTWGRQAVNWPAHYRHISGGSFICLYLCLCMCVQKGCASVMTGAVKECVQLKMGTAIARLMLRASSATGDLLFLTLAHHLSLSLSYNYMSFLFISRLQPFACISPLACAQLEQETFILLYLGQSRSVTQINLWPPSMSTSYTNTFSYHKSIKKCSYTVLSSLRITQ